MKNTIFTLLTILSLTLLSACGQKSSLYIPVEPEIIAAETEGAAEDQSEEKAE
ncbi:MAG: putative small lipoprotein YifL [Cryomorphaceae bacterium]|jgi:predicted small lipoprotein YifL